VTIESSPSAEMVVESLISAVEPTDRKCVVVSSCFLGVARILNL
jgi:hypothetical protein